MRSTEDCIARVAARGKISEAEAAQIIEDVAMRAQEMRRSGVGDPVVSAAYYAAQAIKGRAAADRIDALNNATKRSEALTRAESEAEAFAPKQTVAGRLVPGMKVFGIADGLRSMMHWMPDASRHDNAETMWQTLSRNLIASTGNRLRQQGIEKAALRMRGTDLEYEVAEAMWRDHGGVPDKRVEISPAAQQIADAFSPPLEHIKQRQNAEGARIGTAIDYVTHTNWNPRQLRLAAGYGADSEAAFRAWKEREAPRMSPETFKDLRPFEGETEEQARDRFLHSVFFATASGIHMSEPGLAGMASDGDGFIPPVFEGTRNIGRSVSQPRVVRWNNARDWLDHMREFGGGDGLYAQVSRTLDAGARKTALMHYFGTNPEANLNLLIKQIREQNREDLDGLKRFDAQVPNLQNTMGRLTGSLNIPANEDRARAFEALMTWEAASRLGGVAVTHLAAAPATFTSELAHHGVSRIEGLARIVRSLVSGRGATERQEALADAGAYASGYVSALARLGSPVEAWHRDGIPGAISWGMSHFIRMTGLEYALGHLQAEAVKSVLMDRLGRGIGRPLSEMEEHQQAVLRSYGIGDDDWRILNTAATPATPDGKRWVTPSDALESDPDQVKMLLRSRNAGRFASDRAVREYQWQLADKLGMYLNDAADHGAVRPGVRERAMVLGNLRPGDKSYMLWRALGQFKMWPLAAANQILGREIAMSLSRKEMASNIGFLVALATAGGALRMAVNDAAIGNTQRDYRNPVTLLAALAQGGGLGIYGDFLFGETSRLGAGGLSTLTGPIAADVDRLYRMYSDFKTELRDRPDRALNHLWPDLARFAVGHVPFANLVYLKGALDYLLWYHIYEAASPGWWERTNRRMEKERGRSMAGYEPGAGVPTGIPHLYLQTGRHAVGLLAGH